MTDIMRKIGCDDIDDNIFELKEQTRSHLHNSEVQIWNLCRTCLNNVDAQNAIEFVGAAISYVGLDGKVLCLKDMLQSITGIEPLNDCRLPMKICKLCVDKISSFYVFKSQTMRAERVLKGVLNKLDSKDDANNVIHQNYIVMSKDVERSIQQGTGTLHVKQEFLDCEVSEEGRHDSDEGEPPVRDEIISKGDNAYEECDMEGYDTDDFPIPERTIESAKLYSLNIETDETLVGVSREKEDSTAAHSRSKIPTNVKLSQTHRGREKSDRALLDNLTCVICNAIFVVQRQLISHVQTDHPSAKAFRCRICGQMFSHLQSLSRHKQSHLPRKYKKDCYICEKSFLRTDDWKRHLRTHTGERPYTCDICQKGFKQVGELKEHGNTHMRDGSYVCNICGHTLRSRNGLYMHKKAHEGINKHRCSHCGKRFTSNSELKSHLHCHNVV